LLVVETSQAILIHGQNRQEEMLRQVQIPLLHHLEMSVTYLRPPSNLKYVDRELAVADI
jgi:hypothetical protein